MAEEKRITVSHGIQEFWIDLTNNQRRILLAGALIVLIVMISGWLSSMAVTHELKKLERDAAHAAADKEDALKKAAKIVSEIREKELDLKKLEDDRNEVINKLEIAGRDTAAARAEYDRAVRNKRADIGSDELCQELGELGYPCD